MFRLIGVRQDFHSHQLESGKLHLTTFKKKPLESKIKKVVKRFIKGHRLCCFIDEEGLTNPFFHKQQKDGVFEEALDTRLMT